MDGLQKETFYCFSTTVNTTRNRHLVTKINVQLDVRNCQTGKLSLAFLQFVKPEQKRHSQQRNTALSYEKPIVTLDAREFWKY